MSIELHLGDCMEVMRGFPEQSIDLIVTSPPYFNARSYSQYSAYEEYLSLLSDFAIAARRWLKPDRIFAVNLSCVIEPRVSRSYESKRLPIPFDFVGIATQAGFKFLDEIVWHKSENVSSRAKKFSHHRRPVAYKPYPITEYVLIFKNGEGLIDGVIRDHDTDTISASLIGDGYERTNVWRIDAERVQGHPAPFPLVLAQNLVRYYSFVGDTVADPFMGSGTTGLACAKTGRNFIGIEVDEGYFKLARNRIDEIALQLPLLEVA